MTTKTDLHQLDQPLQPQPTDAEKAARAIRKITAARELVVLLCDQWIATYQSWRRHRDAGNQHSEEQAMLELERLEGASKTAELLLSISESAYKRLLTGPIALLLCFATLCFATLTGCFGDPQAAQQETICTEQSWQLQTTQTTTFPITVELDPTLPAAAEYATLEAMARWNHWMDTEVFGDVVVGQRSQLCGTVYVSMAPSTKVLARTVYTRCNAIMGITPQALEQSDSVVTVSHELGHVLGLPHEYDGSLMSERAGSREEPSRMARCIVATALTEADGLDGRMLEFRL